MFLILEARYDCGGFEPSLSEVLSEPIVHLLMRRDRVAEVELQKLVRGVRRAIRRFDIRRQTAA